MRIHVRLESGLVRPGDGAQVPYLNGQVIDGRSIRVGQTQTNSLRYVSANQFSKRLFFIICKEREYNSKANALLKRDNFSTQRKPFF